MFTRLAFFVTVALLAVGELAMAGNVSTSREPTHIPAEPLGRALRTLANERGFQVVYVSGQVDQQRTHGASGDLTVNEALTRILRGTGLTFYRMSDSGVVIEPIVGQTDSALPHSRPGAQAHPVPSAPNGSSDATPEQLDLVTIEATKDRQTLRRQVNEFVTSVIVQPWGDALSRWNEPICPLVTGLPKAFGELILRRISRAAIDAHAPLAGRECHANLYVMATYHPDLLLEKWWADDREMYHDRNVGIERVERFIHSPLPIRAWYNTDLNCSGDIPVGSGSSRALFGPFPLAVPMPACTGTDTRLIRVSTWANITSAIVVIDLRRTSKVAIGQIADYVALVGLADVRLDADPGREPSILQLFRAAKAPQGLSVWDCALLYALYHTDQWSKLQVSQLKAVMMGRIAR